MKLFNATGIVHYDKFEGEYRLVIKVNQEISNYYFSLIPKYYKVNRPRWPAHITLVRSGKEVPKNMAFWGVYEGKRIPFLYDPEIKSGTMYYWLNIWCKQFENMRFELGLPVVSQYAMPPLGFVKCFHCTIANIKNI